MTTGRPTLYNEGILTQTLKYCQEYEQEGDVIPSIAGLAVYLGITRETIHTWVKEPDKAEFSYIIKGLLALQEKRLVGGGLDESYNSTIAKLILSKHGYSDSQRIEAIVDSKLSDEEKVRLNVLLNDKPSV